MGGVAAAEKTVAIRIDGGVKAGIGWLRCVFEGEGPRVGEFFDVVFTAK